MTFSQRTKKEKEKEKEKEKNMNDRDIFVGIINNHTSEVILLFVGPYKWDPHPLPFMTLFLVVSQ